MVSARFSIVRAAVFAAAIFAGSFWFVVGYLNSYGWTLFVGAPTLLGFAASAFLAIGRRVGLWTAFGTAMLSGLFAGLALLFVGWEGAICLFMALPLAAPLILLGAWIGHLIFHRGRAHPSPDAATTLLAALLAVAGIAEASVERVPVIDVAEDSIVVRASVAETWRAVVGLSDVAPSRDFLFRAGIACPQRARIVEPRAGGQRICTMSTGTLMERIDDWRPNERLSWRAVSTPPPMRELNPFREVDAPHLHGFYRNVRGEFALEPLGPRLTRLTRRTWYSADLYPSLYWKLWCDMGASKIQRFVLEEVRRATERP